MSSSHAYLHPILGSRPNLTIRTARVGQPGRPRRPAPRHRRRVPHARPAHATRSRRRGARSSLSAGAIDTPEAAHALGHRPGRAPAGVRRSTSSSTRPAWARTSTTTSRASCSGTRAKPMVRTSTQWWEIGLFSTSEPGLDRPDLMMHYGSVPFDMNTDALGLPDDRERLLPDAERLPRALARHRAPALARLPRPRARGPALLHRPRGPRRAGDALRRQARAQDRLAAGDGRVGGARAGARARRRQPTTSSSTTSTRPTTPSTTRRARRTWAPTPTARRCVDPRLRVRGVQGLRVADGSVMPFLPAINPCITTMMIGEKCADMLIQDARAAPPSSAASGERLTAPPGGRGRGLPAPPPAVRRARADADVQRVAAAAEVEHHPAGTTIFSQGAEPVGHLRVVRSGAVELVLDGRVLDLLGVGELFGQASMLSGLPTGFTARAPRGRRSATASPPTSPAPLLGRPEALRYVVALAAGPRAPGARRGRRAGGDATRPTSPSPRSCAGRWSSARRRPRIREAAQRMTRAGRHVASSSTSASALGILTDRDLRTRVVAGGLSADAPVSAAMTRAGLHGRRPTALGARCCWTCSTAASATARSLSATGRVLGVVEDADLVGRRDAHSFHLRAAIARATTTRRARRRRRATCARRSSRCTARATAPLHVAGDPLGGRRRAHPAADRARRRRVGRAAERPFAWLALGSLARREATAGLRRRQRAWRGAARTTRPGDLSSYALAISRRVDGGAAPRAACALDARGTTAANPLLVRSLASWRRAAQSWLEDPTQEQALILVSVVVDSRPVWGIHTGRLARRGLPRRARAIRRCCASWRASRSPTARPPASCAGSSSSTPASTAAGWTSSTAASCRSSTSPAGRAWRPGVTSASTPERLRAAAAAGTLSGGGRAPRWPTPSSS